MPPRRTVRVPIGFGVDIDAPRGSPANPSGIRGVIPVGLRRAQGGGGGLAPLWDAIVELRDGEVLPAAVDAPRRPVTDYSSDDIAPSYYGKVIPISAGRRAISGEIIWASPPRNTPVDIQVDPDTPRATPVNYQVDGVGRYVDFAVSFGQSLVPQDELKGIQLVRLWINGNLALDRSRFNPGGFCLADDIDFALYPGSETQEPDPVVEFWEGAGNAPAFRGLIYTVFANFPMHRYNLDQIPEIRAEFQDVLVASNVVEVAEFGRPAGETGVPSRGWTPDWPRARAVAITRPGGTEGEHFVVTFDTINGRQTSRSSIVNADGSLLTRIQAVGGSGGDLFVEPWGGRLIVSSESTNRRPIHAIDPRSGQVTGTFGTAGLGGNSPDGFRAAIGYAAVEGGTGGQRVIGVISIGTADVGTLQFLDDGELEFHDTTAEPIDTASSVFISSGGSDGSLAGSNLYVGTEKRVFRLSVSAAIDEVTQLWDVDLDGLGPGLDGEILEGFSDQNTDDLYVIYNTSAFFVEDSLRMARLGPDPNTVRWDQPLPFTPQAFGVLDRRPAWNRSDITANVLGIHVGGTGSLYTIDLRNGAVTEIPLSTWRRAGDTADQPLPIAINANHAWSGACGLLIGHGEGAPVDRDFEFGFIRDGQFGLSGQNPVALSDLLRWYALRADYEPGEIEVSGIDDRVVGSIISTRVSFGTLTADMSAVFRFDVVETSNRVRFVRRARGVDLTVDVSVADEELAPIDASGEAREAGETSLRVTRAADEELPNQVELRYIDETIDYALNVAVHRRTNFPFRTTSSGKTINYQVPIIFTPGEASILVAQAMYEFWEARRGFQFRTGPKYMRVEPSDVAAVQTLDRTFVIKVEEASINADYSVTFRGQSLMVEDDVSFDTREPTVIRGVVPGPSASELFVLDTPALLADDIGNNTGRRLYVAAASAGQAGWPGTLVRLDTSGTGTGFRVAAVVTPDVSPGFWGVALDRLVGVGAYTVDVKGSLLVTPVVGGAGLVASQTLDEAAAGTANLLLYGATGRWEVIQPLATQVDANGNIVMTSIRRGLLGTGEASKAHAVGDRLLSLERRALALIDLDNLPVGAASQIQAVADQVAGDNRFTNTQGYEVNGNFERPLAPHGFAAAPSGNDLALSWLRVSRVALPGLPDGVSNDPPVFESPERYELEILDGPGGNVLRTVTGLSSAAHTYPEADILADFGSVPAELSVRVFQVSARGERGFPGDETARVE